MATSDAGTDAAARRPPLGQRALVATAAGALGMALVWHAWHVSMPGRPTDFDQIWIAGRAELAGRDAYALIGPGRPFDWPWRFLYPLTAPASVAPLLFIPLELARYLFIFASCALLGWAVTRRDWLQVPMFFGAPFVFNGLACQWSALITAALCIPGLTWVMAAKPNFATLLLANFSRRDMAVAIVGGLVLLGVTVIVSPDWIGRWITVAQTGYTGGIQSVLVTAPGGPLILLALLRWRRPEARLILVMGCIPITVTPYSFLPLGLLAATRMQAIVLALLGWIPAVMPLAIHAVNPELGSPGLRDAMYLLFYFAPAIALLLRQRNERPDQRSSAWSGR